MRHVIVGAGPAGLSAAHFLARTGYRVTIFEALSVAGGMMRDLLCGEPPTVLREDLYIVVSLAGGALLIVRLNYLPFDSSSLITFVAIVLMRFWVIHRGLSLPSIRGG